jgi:hypothetical protein
MGQPKAPNVNWLDEAWIIRGVLAALPDRPSLSPNVLRALVDPAGELASRKEDQKKGPPLDVDTRESIEDLQDLIAVYLKFRLRTYHKNLTYDVDRLLLPLRVRNPPATTKALADCKAFGTLLHSGELWAFDAHLKLGRVLIDRFVSREWSVRLPLVVASIGSNALSETPTLKSSQPRARKSNELRDAKYRVLSRNPGLYWKELLRQLEGDRVVTQWDDDCIEWLDLGGTSHKTKTGTFKNWGKSKSG